jgi:tetratricopeptide repeat protein 21B
LERDPTAYEGLASMIDLLRRAGKLDVAVKQLEAAEKASKHGEADPGLNYCQVLVETGCHVTSWHISISWQLCLPRLTQGLYERWMHRPNQALKRFNKARKDTVWGVRALYQMVEICLNPEHETVGGEAMAR